MDEFGVFQRKQMMDAAEARNGNKLVLKRDGDKVDTILAISVLVTLFFGWILLYIPMVPLVPISLWRYYKSPKVYVKNIANGEKFYLARADWNQYKADRKASQKHTKSLDDLK